MGIYIKFSNFQNNKKLDEIKKYNGYYSLKIKSVLVWEDVPVAFITKCNGAERYHKIDYKNKTIDSEFKTASSMWGIAFWSDGTPIKGLYYTHTLGLWLDGEGRLLHGFYKVPKRQFTNISKPIKDENFDNQTHTLFIEGIPYNGKYVSKLYEDGKLCTGSCFYKSKLYKNGIRFNGIHNDMLYKEGVLVDERCYNYLYVKKGAPSALYVRNKDNLIIHNNQPLTGIKWGVTFENGRPLNWSRTDCFGNRNVYNNGLIIDPNKYYKKNCKDKTLPTDYKLFKDNNGQYNICNTIANGDFEIYGTFINGKRIICHMKHGILYDEYKQTYTGLYYGIPFWEGKIIIQELFEQKKIFGDNVKWSFYQAQLIIGAYFSSYDNDYTQASQLITKVLFTSDSDLGYLMQTIALESLYSINMLKLIEQDKEEESKTAKVLIPYHSMFKLHSDCIVGLYIPELPNKTEYSSQFIAKYYIPVEIDNNCEHIKLIEMKLIILYFLNINKDQITSNSSLICQRGLHNEQIDEIKLSIKIDC